MPKKKKQKKQEDTDERQERLSLMKQFMAQGVFPGIASSLAGVTLTVEEQQTYAKEYIDMVQSRVKELKKGEQSK